MADLLNELMNAGNWIETYIINGFMGNGFQVILKAILKFFEFKPLLDLIATLFGTIGA